MEGAIVKEDIAKVSALVQQVLGVEKFRSMTRLGGLTNHTYKVELDNNEAYVVPKN